MTVCLTPQNSRDELVAVTVGYAVEMVGKAFLLPPLTLTTLNQFSAFLDLKIAVIVLVTTTFGLMIDA